MSRVKKAISAIIFDAGDVLVHQTPDEDVNVTKTIHSKLSGNNKVSLSEYFTQIYDKTRILGSGSKIEFVKIELPDQTNLTLPIQLICQYEIMKWWQNPDPQLEETLIDLWKQGFRLAILTDSVLPSATIRDILNQVSPYIHTIVSSRDVGAMKPDHRMYSAVLDQLNISAKKGLFIAHDVEEIQGALEVGLFCENYEEIKSLQNLIEVIRQKYVFSE
ncbi:MAG: HAD family hydrolase [Candidatus Hodarchaeota archaeon]